MAPKSDNCTCFAIEPGRPAHADLHVHSSASDGSFAPEELPAMAAKAGLSAFALTDHDSLEGVVAACEAASNLGICVVPGVELTGYAPSPDNGGDFEVHIAGLFLDPRDRPLQDKLRTLRSARIERVHGIVRKLHAAGVEIDAEEVLKRARGAAAGRVHVASEVVEQGYCRSIGEVFQRYIGAECPAYVPKEKLTPPQTIALVKAAGGCAVLCHPTYIDHLDDFVAQLVEAGLDALEVHYPSHTPQDEKKLLDMARHYGLAVTGGSDFHGAAKPDFHLGQQTVSFVELCELKRRAIPAPTLNTEARRTTKA